MSNVLSDIKREQVIALGRLGWSLRRIQRETRVRRETASDYLTQAGIPIRAAGWHGKPREAKPAIQMSTNSGGAPSGAGSNPAMQVSTDSSGWAVPKRSPQASACEAHREFIEQSLVISSPPGPRPPGHLGTEAHPGAASVG